MEFYVLRHDQAQAEFRKVPKVNKDGREYVDGFSLNWGSVKGYKNRWDAFPGLGRREASGYGASVKGMLRPPRARGGEPCADALGHPMPPCSPRARGFGCPPTLRLSATPSAGSFRALSTSPGVTWHVLYVKNHS